MKTAALTGVAMAVTALAVVLSGCGSDTKTATSSSSETSKTSSSTATTTSKKPKVTETPEAAKGPNPTIADLAVGTTKISNNAITSAKINSTGIAKNRVDASTWEALRRVGRYSDSTRDASVKIDVECLVDNPADV
jgi:PKD repeat protein